MSKNPFNTVNLFIALQYLLARKKQSILAMIGVLLGVTVFIVMISFMMGVNRFLDDAVFNGSPDITIRKKINTADTKKNIASIAVLEDTPSIDQLLSSTNTVASFAHQLTSPAILISAYQQLPVGINGVFYKQETTMVDLERRLISGQGFKSLKDENNILLGVSLAKRLRVTTGDQLTMILPNGKSKQLIVSGVFSFGITTIDNIRTYVNAGTIQQLLGRQSNTITQIHVKLKDRNDLSLKPLLAQHFNAIDLEDWQDNNKTIVIGNKVRNILTWTISFALLLIAGFGIYNILNSTVIQKRKDIAVLKTMGYSSKDIIFIFLTQSLVIGVLGAVLGAVLGYLISYAISKTPIDTSDFIIVDTYPIVFDIQFYVLAIIFGIVTALFAGYFPSNKASKIDPVQIIRGL